MANELKLRFDLMDTMGSEHFTLAREAESGRETETTASTTIQSHWRSYTVRRNFGRVKRASGKIQACWRGSRGRKRALNFSRKVASEGRQKHFHQAAIEIQRMWRGSHSRRRIHSFYDRKRYLASVLNVGETLRQNMEVHHDNLSQTELLEKEEKMRDTFLGAIRGMHHLASTEVCPGRGP